MKELVVLSGKGGTGKTTVTASLTHLAAQTVPLTVIDADVDAANLEIVLDPKKLEEHVFMGMDVAVIDADRCAGHGVCQQVCRFDAIQVVSMNGREISRVDVMLCEGCAACTYQCPEKAIRMEPHQAGLWFHSDTRYGPLFHAHLFAGQPNSGKLVALIKQQARQYGQTKGKAFILVDGPAGIGCPVISSLSGADCALVVTEPTVSGVHDLERVLGTARHFDIPAMVVINKADLNEIQLDAIESYCRTQHIEIVGRIPFDPIVTEAMVQGFPVTAYHEGRVSQALEGIWAGVKDRLLGSTIFLPFHHE